MTSVEWWLYADKTLGDSYNFSDQYPGNTENKIFLGESTVPVSGTTIDGTWTAQFTVPTNGVMVVTRDGQSPGGLPAPRTYQIPAGTYSVQSHIQNAWWLANEGVLNGRTAMTSISLDAGTSAPPPPPPVVQNSSAEAGVPPTCFEATGYGASKVLFTTTTLSHSGKRALSMVITSISSGDRKWLTSQSDACAPAVTPGKAYTLSVWLNSTSRHNTLTVFRESAAGWQYWTDVKTVGANTKYVLVGGTTPPVPAGTTRIAFGIAASTVGTVRTDDYAIAAA